MKVRRGTAFLFALIITGIVNAAVADADLEHVVTKGDAEGVAAAIKAGADVNARFAVGRTALIIAAMRGRTQMVEALIDAGADMYIRDSNGHDAFMAAVEYEQLAVMRALLNRGFDTSRSNWRALFALVRPAAVNAVPDDDLERAVTKGNADDVATALNVGANVNARFAVGKTPLMLAAQRGRVASMEALLDAGADMYARDHNGNDALIAAVEYEQVEAVRTLLSRGFDPARNEWRALKKITGGYAKDTAGPRYREIRQMLLAYQKKGAPSPTSPTAKVESPRPATPVVDNAPSVTIDTSGKKVTPEVFKTAASKALLRRGWKIITTENNRLVGTLTKDKPYRAVVEFSAPLIVISYEKEYGSPRQNWLLNIRKDLLVELDVLLINP